MNKNILKVMFGIKVKDNPQLRWTINKGILNEARMVVFIFITGVHCSMIAIGT